MDRKFDLLRQKAEELIGKKSHKMNVAYSEAEILGLIHELDIRHVELEIQNEELVSAISETKLLAERYQDLYDFSPTGLITLSSAGDIIGLNLMAAQLLGKERSYLKGSMLGFFVSQETRPVFNLFIEKIFQSGKREACEVVLTTKDREPVYVYIAGTATEKGDTCLLTVTDISDRKHAEEALRESEHHIRVKLEALLLPDGDIGNLELADIIDVEAKQSLMDDFYSLTKIGVGIVDLKGRVLVSTGWQDICTKFHRVNPVSCRNCTESDLYLSSAIEPGSYKVYKCKNNMWDISTPIVVGNKHLGNILLGQFLFEGEEPDYALFRKQAKLYGFDEDEYFKALDRVPRWNKEMVGQAMNFYSKLANFISKLSCSNVLLARSVEDLNRTKQVLGESETNLRKLNINNDKLFSIIAHDLRSPFNAIMGFSNVMIDEINSLKPEEIKEYSHIINDSASSTLALLDNLLMWARTQSGQVGFNRENLVLGPIILEILDVLKLNAIIKNISLDHLPFEGTVVYADKNMLATIIRNLVSNAIKFTNPGGKIVIYAVQNQDSVQISISDSGVGMNQDVCNKIFASVSNMTSRGTANEKGSGLGLVLCKELVAKHGGRIWAESQEGLGSTFHFTIPSK